MGVTRKMSDKAISMLEASSESTSAFDAAGAVDIVIQSLMMSWLDDL